MTIRRVVIAAIVAALSISSARVALAQPTTADLTGRVTDAVSAALASASVSLRNAATSRTWMTATDADGRFGLTDLPPGTYQIDITLAGYDAWQLANLTLQAGQARYLDVHLAAENTPEAAAFRDIGSRTAVDSVISASRLQSLPLNGRNFLELGLTVPGNSPAPTFDQANAATVLMSSAGQLGRGGNFMIDGQDNNDDVLGGPLLNLPIDSVQEVQVATNRFGAELGRSAASAINIVTRSGSNDYHGSASLFARDQSWQADQPTTPTIPAGARPFARGQLAGSLGGPLVRDRAFWFASGENRNQNGSALVGFRDQATRSIDTAFIDARFDQGLWLARVDTGGAANRFMLRVAGERIRGDSPGPIERALGSPTQFERKTVRSNSVLAGWTFTPSNAFTTALQVGASGYLNDTEPAATLPQYTFPSLQDGASFQVPDTTRQTRFQIASSNSWVRGAHLLRTGGDVQRIGAEFTNGIFQQGRVDFVQDFPIFDHNSDGRLDDNDLIFALTLRNVRPSPLVLPHANNVHVGAFLQDDWRLTNDLQLNLGMRYEVDTDVNDQSRVGELNPLVTPFLNGKRTRDLNNLAPRIGFAWAAPRTPVVISGGFGVYFDRIVLQVQSLERTFDGRQLPIEVRAGNLFYLDPNTGRLPASAPTVSNPFVGALVPGAGALGIDIIDSHLQSPMVRESHLGIETEYHGFTARADGLINRGSDFLLGRVVGQVFNPVADGPDRVVNIESSGRTRYDALLLSLDRPFGFGNALDVSYTLSKADNYTNSDQIPLVNEPLATRDASNVLGPAPTDRRHRLVASGQALLPWRFVASGIWTFSSGVPMDILMPDGLTRVPGVTRNAGGRQFKTAGDLNAFITRLNASGGVNGVPLPLVRDDAKFSDQFNSLDLRIARTFDLGSRSRIEAIAEVFNVFNVTNILGLSNVNYSGYSNALVRDSPDPSQPGYLRSSSFGIPLTTAGGLFGSGGPRGLQVAVRLLF